MGSCSAAAVMNENILKRIWSGRSVSWAGLCAMAVRLCRWESESVQARKDKEREKKAEAVTQGSAGEKKTNVPHNA
jgi:hypothetical protein